MPAPYRLFGIWSEFETYWAYNGWSQPCLNGHSMNWNRGRTTLKALWFFGMHKSLHSLIENLNGTYLINCFVDQKYLYWWAPSNKRKVSKMGVLGISMSLNAYLLCTCCPAVHDVDNKCLEDEEFRMKSKTNKWKNCQPLKRFLCM